jgi:AraC-like DNA-binding protein
MARGDHASSTGVAADLEPPARFAFTTDQVPESGRARFFKEELAPFLNIDVTLLGDAPPRHAMSFARVGSVALSSIDVSPMIISRDRSHIGDEDGFFFNPMTTGWQLLNYKGNSIRFEAGEGCLMHLSETADCVFPEGGSAVGIRISGPALRALCRHPEDAIGKPVRRDHPGVALLMGYLRSFSDAKDTLTPGLQLSFGHHIVDVIAAIVGTSTDGAEQAETGGIRAARRQHVLKCIAERACDPRFSVELVAADLAVTSRAIQLMLEETGATFSEHVGEHRLRRAWQLLADPGSRLSIAEIAYEAGFNDLSYFYRAFRRRFGETPGRARGGPRTRAELH